jgi:hypothetical protein
MKKYFVLILSVLTLNTSCAQRVGKNTDSDFINFVNSFKEEKKSDIIDFRKIKQNKAPMSKAEALKYVYHTNDTTKLYCVEFDYSNETEEFRGIIGASLWLPNKCLKIDMENYFIIAYNSYHCINNINNCPDPNNLRHCFLNEDFNVFLTLCIVDKEYNLKDSMLVCKDDGELNYFVSGLLNPHNSKIFLSKIENNGNMAYIYIVNKDFKFECIKESNVSEASSADFNEILEELGWVNEFEMKLEYYACSA